MLQIALIRPGTTDYDAQGRIQGTLQVPLNDAALPALQTVSGELRQLSLTTIYSADCLPAIETAHQLAQHLEIKHKTLDQLPNVNHGLWQGLQVEDVRKKHPKVYRQWEELAENVCPPEGETLGQAKERLTAALKKVLKKHDHGVIGLVLPRPLFELAVCLLGKGTLGQTWSVAAEHQGWDLMGAAPPSLVASS